MMRLLVISIFVLFLNSCQSADEVRYEQYLINGEMLYKQNCTNCHGKEGEGLKNLYPPLKNADFFENQNAVICIIKNGASGEMVVNGKTYNQAMPANRKLYPLDIAQLTTWMYHEFQDDMRVIETDTVKAVLKRCL